MTPAGELVMKRLILAIIAVIMIILGCALLAYGQEISIDATTEENSISIIETIDIDVAIEGNISFWIQDGATEIDFIVDGNSIAYDSVGGNEYISDISALELTDESTVQITHLLAKDTSVFEKTLLYNITSLTITFDNTEIYSGTNLKTDSAINIALPEEPQTTTQTNEVIPIWIYAIILILIILLLASFAKSGKKQKSTKKKETISDSKELLIAKKALLMESLKDIEKKHRAKKISDDTYHKLKDKYKQEAVETMKKLEDIK